MPPSRSSKLIIDLMSEKSVSQTELSKATNVSVGYTNHVVTGRRLPSAKWLDLVSETMGLSDQERRELHRQTVIDLAEKNGYDVDK